MDQTTNDESAIRARLAERYSDQTGEAAALAAGPVDVVVACMTAGLLASLSSENRPLAGMIQAVGGEVSDIRQELREALPATALVHGLLTSAQSESPRPVRYERRNGKSH